MLYAITQETVSFMLSILILTISDTGGLYTFVNLNWRVVCERTYVLVRKINTFPTATDDTTCNIPSISYIYIYLYIYIYIYCTLQMLSGDNAPIGKINS